MSDGDDGELLARLRAGDPGALDGLVSRHPHRRVAVVAYLADPDTADDLTQQTYERALQALPGSGGEATLRTWLLAIARRVVADELRARGRHRRLAAAAAQHHRELTADVGEQVLLRQLVAGLEPARRESFVLTPAWSACPTPRPPRSRACPSARSAPASPAPAPTCPPP